MNKYINDKINIKVDNKQIMHYEISDIDRILYETHGVQYTEYRKEWDKATNFEFIPDRPLYIVMETNSYCNMKCKMCIRNYDLSKNRAINIDMGIIKKVVNECRKLKVPSFFIGAEAECLINPNIKEIITTVKQEGGGIDNFLITNGYELNDDISKLLIDLQWERVYISIDAATAQTYKNIRGKSLERVENNILRLLELRKKANSLLPIVRVSFVIQEENRNEKEMFIEKWKDKVDIIDFQNLIHYDKMDSIEEYPDISYQCAYPFRTLLLDCDGNLYPCCTEFGYKMCIGNIYDLSIQEAWNSNYMNK